ELVANVQAWKRNVKLVVIHELLEDGSIKAARLIACTDMDKDGGEVLFAYHSRFQIEILYREAKQHLGLRIVRHVTNRKSIFTSMLA
ncbi:MAG: hypothetical protein AAFO03_01890, partial [Bacteroidota bacterium]